jgi:3-oxoacyl-[acyl-carrier protein] reductase
MGLIQDRVAVVTGAGRGIGRAIALLFVEEGAKVTINDVDAAPAHETARLCRERGGEAAASVGSVADPAYTDRLMKETFDRWGAIDILVNNAGITRDRVVHRMTDEEWDFVIAVNLRGTFNCIRSVAPYMRDVAKKEKEELGAPRHHRKIVNFYSTAAIRGNPGQINYTAAKMGNLGITRTLAQEWGPFWINVNAVAPGLTETRLTQAKEDGDGTMGIPRAQKEAAIARIPFGRAARPEDIARVVLFFSSPLSDFVTGQEINVSGGQQIP